jgi:hypothetical protein
MPYTTDLTNYNQEQVTRLENYYRTNRRKLVGFETFNQFNQWFNQASDNNQHKCHYCNISILDIRRLINSGIINGRLVRGGSLRGPNFEIDRMDPFGEYNQDNCVLSCYYCNNDKSNTFSYTTYKNVIGPLRHESIKLLLRQIE